MAKLALVTITMLLMAVFISGAPDKKRVAASAGAVCGRHGDPCVTADTCCENMRCHIYANRCQVIITEEELMAQREKILGRKGKDY